jgi:chromosome segregation ATPase
MLMIMATSPAGAEQSSLATFDRTLETLRQSVVRLLKENAQINTDNVAARSRIKLLREEIRSLEAETQRLEERSSAEDQKMRARSGGAEGLKQQLAQADGALKRARDDVSAEQDRLSALEDEEKTLRLKIEASSAELARLGANNANSTAASQGLDALRAEQEDLKKQLSEVVNRVEEAKQRWQDINAVVTKGPEQVEVLKAENTRLVNAMSEVEGSLVSGNAQLADLQAAFDKIRAEDHSDIRLGRLDSEVKDMAERNRKLESEVLTITRTKEETLKRLQADQEKLDKHYRAQYEELLQRNVDLKAELDSLRKQMVEMDKKKAGLEALVYPER